MAIARKGHPEEQELVESPVEVKSDVFSASIKDSSKASLP